LAVAENRYAVGELKDFVKAMRHIHDPKAVCAPSAEDLKDPGTSVEGSAAVGSSSTNSRVWTANPRAIATRERSAIDRLEIGRSASRLTPIISMTRLALVPTLRREINP
jgi:hypothetical protein